MTLTFQQLPARDQAPPAIKPFDRWVSVDGEETSLFFRESGNYLVRFPDMADFRISLDQQEVHCTPTPGMSDQDIADLYFNQIVPLVMGCQGEPVLHASAVAIDGRAVAFLGPTRRGKSTLAAAFAKAGNPFLTDDGLILDRSGAEYMVRPRAPVLRLCADSEAVVLRNAEPPADADEMKTRISAGWCIAYQGEPLPLAAIYLMIEPETPDQTQIERLPRPAAVSELLKHSFILDVEDRDRVKLLFQRLVALAEQIDCFTLDYPRDYAKLPSVLTSIMGHAPSGGR
jgi:hypothetical protein